MRNQGRATGTGSWSQAGAHNLENALAAMLGARHAGVPLERCIAALDTFAGVKRRLEVRGQVGGVTVYDDFAHHPTAIGRTLQALRQRVGAGRIVAVFEPRSNSMKMGVHTAALAPALAPADRVWLYRPPDLGWDPVSVCEPLGEKASVSAELDRLVADLAAESRSGDHILIMSNGDFGGLHGRLLRALENAASERALP